MKFHLISATAFFVFISCSDTPSGPEHETSPVIAEQSYQEISMPEQDQLIPDSVHLIKPGIQIEPENDLHLSTRQKININNPTKESLMKFAESLIGIPYRYGSSDPRKGFDCSGFITYVFNHFDITVPRSSIDFTNKGERLAEAEAKRGDIILFTGTNPEETFVGHMGLIVSNNEEGLQFIHSTSGKAKSVTITRLNAYYRNRLVGFRRIL